VRIIRYSGKVSHVQVFLIISPCTFMF